MTPEAIQCSACGEASFLKRTPSYEGFRKTGEILSCAACGHVFEAESAVPFRERNRPRVFAPDDRPQKVQIFHSDEAGRCCRHCEHYVVNPFVQRCALHNRVVEATDFCERFSRRRDQNAGFVRL